MTGKSGTGQACAACKYQRRKCSPDCPLAPYFPPDQPKQFLNVHKLFGVSNILRILRQLDDTQRSDAMKSIIYQANAREKDPVHGCFGIIVMLQAQVERLKEEIEIVRSQMMVMEQQQQQQQQFQNGGILQHQQIQGLGGPVNLSNQHSAMPATWVSYPYVQGFPYEGEELCRQSNYDFVRPSRFVEYEQRQQPYGEVKEDYESSAESSLKESQCLDHIADQELKSAAALFTLTNHH
ncbi:protein ASYMMETRIC LEAVES 2 isoform X1 [Cryptomeria japonica]|uniref:protein ASYMMETRIC LEAVES 2 isoform X1 n=1 Tax=Cryptomeria japonica TaxID=3369 RepID=UPI0025ACFD50|nr:protein ASYMMETRIC LEAVES 2 isoform X1 [Cryptomeria japonica]